MTIDSFTKKRDARDIAVGRVRIWYHLPFAIYQMRSALEGWSRLQDQASDDQANYFHSYVTKVLWAQSDVNGRAHLERYQKAEFVGKRFHAQKQVSRDGNHAFATFSGTVDEVSLRLFRPRKKVDESNPAMGMLTVGVTFDEVSDEPTAASETLALQNPRSLTLADAQDFLDWSRRVFARWPDAKKGAKTYTAGDMIERLRVFAPDEDAPWKTIDGPFKLASWVRCLLKPFRMDGTVAELFGDERAFMTSGVLLQTDGPEDAEAREAVCAIQDEDLFRLAEADCSGDTPPYAMDFIRGRLDEYLYNRHAPSADAQSGNAAVSLIAHHHLCMVGAGGFFDHFILGAPNDPDRGPGHVDTYYRHLQFLAVYEYFRLVLFSQRLTRLVPKKQDKEFPVLLQKLREDFLDFTHIHHFSNVSLQLQPREMYSQLYETLGIEAQFADIENELRAANEFVEAKEAQAAAKRAEKLNDLISVGVPLSLIVGATGANLFIGEAHPTSPETPLPWATQLDHLATIVTPIAAVWALLVGALGGKLWQVAAWLCVALLGGLWLTFGG